MSGMSMHLMTLMLVERITGATIYGHVFSEMVDLLRGAVVTMVTTRVAMLIINCVAVVLAHFGSVVEGFKGSSRSA
jgi:hypothetical protein